MYSTDTQNFINSRTRTIQLYHRIMSNMRQMVTNTIPNSNMITME